MEKKAKAAAKRARRAKRKQVGDEYIPPADRDAGESDDSPVGNDV